MDLTRIQFIQKLGSGAFGKVYLCRKRDSKVFVAAKLIAKEQVLRQKMVEHVLAECRILNNINFHFVADYMGYASNNTNVFVFMELVLGGDLHKYIKKYKKLSPEVASFHAIAVILAFSYIHNKGIIHRDLKPENLMVTNKGYCKLVDFGLAKELSPGNRTYTFCGTPTYVAPEVICKTGHGPAADWWCLGILIYDMTVGRPPFIGKSILEITTKIKTGKFVYPEGLDPHTRSIIGHLATVDQSKRYGNGGNKLKDFQNHSFFRKWDMKLLLENKLQSPMVIPPDMVLKPGGTPSSITMPVEGAKMHPTKDPFKKI